MTRHLPRPACALLASVSLLSGCATTALQYGRDGLAPIDRTVRARLEAGQYDRAYDAAFHRDAAARDRLLRSLAAGTLGLYASRTDSSVWALDRAWALTEDRWSRKLGNEAASLVVNDYVLPYTPGETERLFIPFYGALSWLSRGERDEAAVDARRMTQLLGVAPENGDASASGEVRGLLHYVAGAVFEEAGDRSAADVAYRNAARLVQVPVRRDTTAADSLTGDVVVVLEQGFVGHPVPRSETIWLSRDEWSTLRLADDEHSFRTADAIRERHRAGGVGRYYDRPRYEMAISVNWSEYSDGWSVAPVLALAAAGVSPAAGSLTGNGNVSRAVGADFERGQAARFTRALVRAAGRTVLVKAAGDQIEKASDDDRGRASRRGNNGSDDKDEIGFRFWSLLRGLGLFAIAAASEVNDVSDLRSWNLLPYDLRVVRLRLPVGEQDVRAVVDGQEIVVGRATVRRGQVTVLSQRLFRSPSRVGAVASDRY